MAAVSAANGASPGRMVRCTQARLLASAAGQVAFASSPGQRMDLSAERTPAWAREDLPTPEAPIRIGQRPGPPAQRGEHRGGLGRAAVKVIRIGLRHGFETANRG